MNPFPHSIRRTFAKAILLIVATTMLMADTSFADDGQPVAIRRWPDNGITIESMWDLHVGVGLNSETRTQLPRALDLEITDDETLAKLTLSVDDAQANAYMLDRPANTLAPTVSKEDDANAPTTNGIWIRPVVVPGSKPLSQIGVDGVVVIDCGSLNAAALIGLEKTDAIDLIKNNDVIILNDSAATADDLKRIAELCQPQFIVLPAGIDDSVNGLESVDHNTLAVSAAKEETTTTRFVRLAETPFEMQGDLAELYSKKEASSLASQKVFADLSIEQLNFKPSNGTHTPRWNTEHMMGRELGFFSSIYHAIDPSIPVMNLNPKQNPNQYEFRHEDWTGFEESAQAARVQAFNRRFAYLIADVDLDKRIKGNPFPSLRALLRQMERHYDEHTANVVKKMDLPDWPKK